MVVFLKASFLVLHLSYYILTFLLMLSVILLSIVIYVDDNTLYSIMLFTPAIIKRLICGNN